jgi:antitoxin (DNA-binding transcriptional repressor) of toxin-antitoxin stability system
MATVATRELKQNPHAVIQRVLESGEPVAVTAYGKPTGVVIAPERPVKRRWVPGSALRQAVAPLPEDESQAWLEELNATRQAAFGRDL